MAETEPHDGALKPQPIIRILAHFVRDLSFENVGAIEGTRAEGTPEISVTVNLDGSHMSEDRYQVNMKLNAKSVTGSTTRYVAELDYCGVFQIANVEEQHIHPLMFIECPRLILPYARRVMSDVTRDGGHPPLMIDNVDFATLYRQKIEQLRQQQQQPATNPN